MYTEAEIQLLIALVELAQPVETPNNNHYTFYPASLEATASYFKSLRVDWQPAYTLLEAKGLISPGPHAWSLTTSGLQEAARLRAGRPPIYYWYEEFYVQAPVSPVYREFCTRLYGLDLCQAGFSDMQQIDTMIQAAALQPGQRALELGCGAGKVAELLSDRTGAFVLGIDYSPAAVKGALERTTLKRSRLDFQVANLDAFDFALKSFTAILSIDSLYMPADLQAALSSLVAMLAPGGCLLAFYSQFALGTQGTDRSRLLPQGTDLGAALARLGLAFRVQDFTAQTYHMMQHKHSLGEELRLQFAAEGNQALCDFILAESEASPAEYDPLTCPFTRYLYQVIKPEEPHAR